jgi:hypothetical protein
METKVGAKASNRKYSEATVHVRIHASHAACAWIALAALATLALLAVTPGSAAMRILAATWIACAALESIHSRALLRGSRGVRAVRVGEGVVEVEDGDGGHHAGTLVAGSFVAPWLTVVRWRPEGARFDRSLPVVAGMAHAENLRRLRVVLRWA